MNNNLLLAVVEAIYLDSECQLSVNAVAAWHPASQPASQTISRPAWHLPLTSQRCRLGSSVDNFEVVSAKLN